MARARHASFFYLTGWLRPLPGTAFAGATFRRDPPTRAEQSYGSGASGSSLDEGSVRPSGHVLSSDATSTRSAGSLAHHLLGRRATSSMPVALRRADDRAASSTSRCRRLPRLQTVSRCGQRLAVVVAADAVCPAIRDRYLGGTGSGMRPPIWTAIGSSLRRWHATRPDRPRILAVRHGDDRARDPSTSDRGRDTSGALSARDRSLCAADGHVVRLEAAEKELRDRRGVARAETRRAHARPPRRSARRDSFTSFAISAGACDARGRDVARVHASSRSRAR